MKKADELAKQNYLITFGVRPTYPATGFGYIEAGEKYSDCAFHVKQFKEKPDIATAKTFLSKENFYWNSGMFCFSIFNIIESFDKINKEMFEKAVEVSCIKDIKKKLDQYKAFQKIPIDIAIFEKADNIVVMPIDFLWSDVGNWASLSDLMPRDGKDNYFSGDSFSFNSKGNSIFSKKQVALIGVDDLILVETEDSILICKKDDAEFVKNVPSQINH